VLVLLFRISTSIHSRSLSSMILILRMMCEAGPVVYLEKWKVYGVARYDEVYAVLNDPQTFCSSRGVGLSDFAKEKPWRPPSLILEADPPAHTRGLEHGPVAGRHETSCASAQSCSGRPA
jgi:cytochrome P450